ncbi:MAG: hypothetical protein LBH12_03200, partial [Dysgonamonadaceae bacterium]|nr:hypothetical protein [Dysgonamonadaceae bacterium]
MLNLINELNNNLIVNKLNFEFIEQTRQIIGEDLELFLKSFSEKSPISIRLNPYKNKNSDCPFLQTDDKVPWASHAYYLSERPVFTLDPLFHAGVYYVQDASSMYLEPLIKKYVSSPSIVLD